MKPGESYNPTVTIVKVKNGVPTVIAVDGHNYTLRPPNQFSGRKSNNKGERRTT